MKSYGNLYPTSYLLVVVEWSIQILRHKASCFHNFFIQFPILAKSLRNAEGVTLKRSVLSLGVVVTRFLLAHTRTKFGTHIHHDQTLIWTHTLSPTGSQLFWCVKAFFTRLLWKLSRPGAYTPQCWHSLIVIFMPWKTKVMEIIQLCQTWWAWRLTPFFPFVVKHQILVTSHLHQIPHKCRQSHPEYI